MSCARKIQAAATGRVFRLVGLCLAAPVLLAALWMASEAGASTTPTRKLVWPPPPDEPRISYVREFATPAELGAKPSTLGRIGRWIVGSSKESDALVKPFGIALDEQGNLCLTDTGANAVCFFDQKRKLWRKWEKVGDVEFKSPVAVAKRAGIFYVADSTVGCVVTFNEEGRLLTRIRDRLERPTGLALGTSRLFVVDSQKHEVAVFDLKGQRVGQFGSRGTGQGEFNFPTHVSIDGDGNLYVTDSLNSRVQVFGQDGRYLRQVGGRGDAPGQFSRPKGAAVDGFGHLYVVDALFDNIQLFDREGRLLMALGQSGSQPGEFWLPNGIAISPRNEIYVADSYNHRVQVFQFTGQP